MHLSLKFNKINNHQTNMRISPLLIKLLLKSTINVQSRSNCLLDLLHTEGDL